MAELSGRSTITYKSDQREALFQGILAAELLGLQWTVEMSQSSGGMGSMGEPEISYHLTFGAWGQLL